jgi:tetratricopeptide (TPR) repeat protein
MPRWNSEHGFAESMLLLPEEASVPFHASRRHMVDDVLKWATDAKGFPLALQVRVGQGGVGKTRLMLEVCQILTSAGWHAGFLGKTSGVDVRSAFKGLVEENPQILVVIDYAESKLEELATLLETALAVKNRRLRFMLLARDVGEWWDQLAINHPVLEHFLKGHAVSGPYRIHPVPSVGAERETVFLEALAAFARKLNKNPLGIVAPDLSAPHFAEVLYIHLSALAALFGERPETAISLLEATLRRERRYLRDVAVAAGLPERSQHEGIYQAMAVLTLVGGAESSAEAKRFIDATPRLRGESTNAREAVLRILRTFYSGLGGIDPLRPDALGERLIAEELAKDDELLDVALDPKTELRKSKNALTVLNRLARQNPTDVLWLRRGLRRYFAERAELAVTVAIESGDPIGRVVEEVLRDAPVSVQRTVIEQIKRVVPTETVALRECALTAAELHLKRLLSEGKPKGYKQKNRVVEAHFDFATRLASLGRHEDALRTMEHCKSLAEDLAKKGDADKLADLAKYYSNTGRFLSELGRYKEAMAYSHQAVVLCKRLAKRSGKFYFLLAKTLVNLASGLDDIGDVGQAEAHVLESIHILAKHVPESTEKYHDLAMAIANLAAYRAKTGRHKQAFKDAKQSLRVLQALDKDWPDAFRPKLVTGLRNISLMLSLLGRHKFAIRVAKEALRVDRDLAELRPMAFRPDLTLSLGNLADRYSELGLNNEALEHALEAVSIQRELAIGKHRVYSGHLAHRLGVLADVLSDLERLEDALGYAHEALDVYSELGEEYPLKYMDNIVSATNRVASLQIRLGRLDVAQEALEGVRALVQALRARSKLSFELFRYLVLGTEICLQDGRLQLGLEMITEACSITEESFRYSPHVHRAAAATALALKADCSLALGNDAEARRSAQQGLSLLNADLLFMPRQVSPDVKEAAQRLLRLARDLAIPAEYPAVLRALNPSNQP